MASVAMNRLVGKMPLLPLLVYMTDLYDPYGKEHSHRVADLSIRLAKEYGYIQTDEIALSGLLHDVGKIGIPEPIRRLPGRYTEIERLLMQQHPVIGEKLLRMVQNGTVSEVVIMNVRHHHEDWNGGGYPDGLKGDEIPVGARIVRIADFYDAITNVRGYANRRTREDALAFMKQEQRGDALFDPVLFGIFVSESFWEDDE